ncbi:hypothetical protein [Kibdelosporangium phytohabitans]|uniref:hypothetical protein n=1 Tax=Kibdelosporangium phytohabitans TaxID=860235 RepID=UPI001470086E|nr:hypothetical protein [Kibdelosporangium phytohabitans]MBE1466756.1 hypothetical protein [Kibdelosporangium phytohabitans]
MKILGAIVVIWLAFMVIGWIFSAFKWLLIIAAVATVGTLAYGAIKRSQIKS